MITLTTDDVINIHDTILDTERGLHGYHGDNALGGALGRIENQINYDDFMTWGKWFEAHANMGTRHIGHMRIPARRPFKKGGKMLARVNRKRSIPIISTVFLGLDHNHWNMHGNQPILFESMVFGGNFDQYQARYFTVEEAQKEHADLVKRVTKTMVI